MSKQTNKQIMFIDPNMANMENKFATTRIVQIHFQRTDANRTYIHRYSRFADTAVRNINNKIVIYPI